MVESNNKKRTMYLTKTHVETSILGFKDGTELQLYKVKARKDELKVSAC